MSAPSAIPTIRGPVPSVTAEQMAEIDRIAVDELGITMVQMMENAGGLLAGLATARWSPATVTVLAGTGGNGGGALVAARHLHNRGVTVSVTVTAEQRLGAVPAAQLAVARNLGVAVTDEPAPADLVVDGIIGYSLTGDPRGRAADLIAWANSTPTPVLSLDLPSGLDATTGRVGSPCVHADATLTLALPKAGLLRAPQVVGDLYLADISIPPAAYRRIGLDVSDPFAECRVVALAR